MPKIYVCFLWHMHQPFYKDLISGEYKLPWTRMHALKDYYGMVRLLEEFPQVRQTFNLVPSMMVQVEEYATGAADDPFLRAALKPAESLTEEDQDFILQYFFQANPARLIHRYPRYGELHNAWEAADRNARRARRLLGVQSFRDLQVLSQLAWFDEEFLAEDPEVRALVERGRDYTLDDQELIGRKQIEILGKVIPAYARSAAGGQIEISTTPFYHPILPLICDSDVAQLAHPYVPLPSRFRYPQDARLQLDRAREHIESRFGHSPAGLWPSEGSVSDETLAIAADAGFRWAATDNGVLARTLGHGPGADGMCRPYLWRQDGRELRLIFRDHFLSDLIGFVYSRMNAGDAAADLLNRIRAHCSGMLAQGRDALLPIILDGENAWEYYEHNGRPFLRELYRRIGEDPQFQAVTVSEALGLLEPQPLERIFPGSWINANFDVWIGAEEDNTSWEYLLRARQAYDHAASAPRQSGVSEPNLRLALEELLIAEGSDWCWWYGPEHDSANRPEFDRLFRDHLANVYRALGSTPPDELSRPILKVAAPEFHEQPAGPIRPTIDGEVTSFFEWLGAGVFRVDARSGAMHGHRYLIRALQYGCDGTSLYLRLDMDEAVRRSLSGVEARIRVRAPGEQAAASSVRLRLEEGRATPLELELSASPDPRHPAAEFAYRQILEARLPLASLGAAVGDSLGIQVSLWHESLPMDALPQQGWLTCATAEPTTWPV